MNTYEIATLIKEALEQSEVNADKGVRNITETEKGCVVTYGERKPDGTVKTYEIRIEEV